MLSVEGVCSSTTLDFLAVDWAKARSPAIMYEVSFPGSVTNLAIPKTATVADVFDDRSMPICLVSDVMYRAPWEVQETSLTARGSPVVPLRVDKGIASIPARLTMLCAIKYEVGE